MALGLRLEKAPEPSPGKRNVHPYVKLAPGETVEWHWTHTHEGSFVSGYEIHKLRYAEAVIPGFRPLWQKVNAI